MNVVKMTCLFVLFVGGLHVNGQYFGKNQVQYEDYDFEILETPHFQIYHYLKDSQNIVHFAHEVERWYQRHLRVFKDTIKQKNPIILYNNHADFQQTTVIGGIIGTGTSGVTEGLRNRVVMPYLESNRETSHVLGHEMVHVFQYRLVKMHDSLMLNDIRNVPLWMIEGMAEYLSVGKVDAHSGMWMRDAVQQDDIPSLKDMTRKMNEYFPYRYGHAFWCYMTGVWGDKIVQPLLKSTAQWGYKKAVKKITGLEADSISIAWEEALKEYYQPFIDSASAEVDGDPLFTPDNSGRINISPAISPDGKRITFMSDRKVISLDFFLADVASKEVIKTISTSLKKSYVDEYNYLGSTGSWSPDNQKFVLTTFIKGKNRLMVVDIRDGSTKELNIPELEAFNNPSWSPDGKKILITTLVNGQTDLAVYHLEEKKIEMLTDDSFSDLHPEWSPDGKQVAFISDRGPDARPATNDYSSFRLCLYDFEDKKIQTLNLFPGADNIDPHFTPDGQSLLFLSNADGYRNLYQYQIDSQQVYRLTNYVTGISGITHMSPAISVARDTNLLVYTHYQNGKYAIYKRSLDHFTRTSVDPDSVNMDASQVPIYKKESKGDYVTQQLKEKDENVGQGLMKKRYKPKLQLEYIGNSGVGVGYSRYGTGMAGGVNLFFSDILKRNQIYTALMVNGEIHDFAGALSYLNRESRLNWGGSVSHVPYYYFDWDQGYVDTTNNTYIQPYKEIRIFRQQLTAFSQFPFSRKLRLEGGGGIERYSFRVDSVTLLQEQDSYYSNYKEQKIDAPSGYLVFPTYMALVGDNSTFGFTSPMDGYRYRFEINKYFGRRNFWGVLIDYRNYFYSKPVSLALRGVHYGRYGRDENLMYPLFIGNDYYQYIRGYNRASFQNYSCQSGNCLNLYNLVGSKLLVANAELRVPFTGHKRLSFIRSKFFYSDLVFFMDGGLAWYNNLPFTPESNVSLSWEPQANKRIPVFSAGASIRVNLLGMIVLEPYYAFPFQRSLDHGVWGLIFSPGGW